MSSQHQNGQWKVIDESRDVDRSCDSEDEAQTIKNDMISLGADGQDIQIVPPSEIDSKPAESDDSGEVNEQEPQQAEVLEVQEAPTERDADEIQTASEDVFAKSPIEWFGGKESPFIDQINHRNGSSLDLNKDGTQFVANVLGFEVSAECEVTAYESEFEYSRYRATCIRPDGREFNAVGDCHIEEQGKNKEDLERMAETRAKKRAVKWASAGGVEAIKEMQE